MWGAGAWAQAKHPNLIPSVSYLQFFPGDGQAHLASGAGSLGAQPSVGSDQTGVPVIGGKI